MNLAEIFNSWEHLSCTCFTGGQSGGFKLVDFDEPFQYVFEKGKSDYFLLFILEGFLNVSYNDFYTFGVNAGDMFVLSEGCRVQGREAAKCVLFRPGTGYRHNGCMVMRMLAGKKERMHDVYTPLKVCHELGLFLDLLKIFLPNGIVCEYLQAEKQEEFFGLLARCYTNVELRELFFPFLASPEYDFRITVGANSMKTRNTKELAERCGYPPAFFRKTFREIFGMSVYHWIQMQKAEQIRLRLCDINTDLKELSFEFGFSTVARLDGFCRKWLGKSPVQYMEQNKTRCRLMLLSIDKATECGNKIP